MLGLYSFGSRSQIEIYWRNCVIIAKKEGAFCRPVSVSVLPKALFIDRFDRRKWSNPLTSHLAQWWKLNDGDTGYIYLIIVIFNHKFIWIEIADRKILTELRHCNKKKEEHPVWVFRLVWDCRIDKICQTCVIVTKIKEEHPVWV